MTLQLYRIYSSKSLRVYVFPGVRSRPRRIESEDCAWGRVRFGDSAQERSVSQEGAQDVDGLCNSKRRRAESESEVLPRLARLFAPLAPQRPGVAARSPRRISGGRPLDSPPMGCAQGVVSNPVRRPEPPAFGATSTSGLAPPHMKT